MNQVDKVATHINAYHDWRGDRLRELRQLIKDSAPQLQEDFKWGVPVWTHNGLVCAISGFKDHVKFNFFKGAYLPDPNKQFNSGLDSKEHRSINFAQADQINKPAIKQLILDAIALNNR